MIEHDVAQYIADNSSHELGVDLAAYNLPQGAEEGLFVRISTEEYEHSALVSSFVTVFVTYSEYYRTREVAVEVKDLLVNMKGLGDWATGGDVTIVNLGENKQGACLFGVTSQVKHV